MSTEAGAVEAPVTPEIVEEEQTTEEVVTPEVEQTEEVAAQPEGTPEEKVKAAEAAAKEAIKNGMPEKKVQQALKEYKIKVYGKEKTVKLDIGNDEEVMKRLQLAEAYPEAARQAAELKKAHDALEKRIMEDPFALLKEKGLDPDKLSEDHIQKLIEQMQKSPEQVEREKKDAELEQLRAELKEKKESERAAVEQAALTEAMTNLENEILSTLDKNKLPKNPTAVKRIADTMAYAMDNGYPDITVEQVAEIVEKEIQREQQAFLDSLPDDILEEWIGKKTTERLRQRRLAQAKSAAPSSKVKPAGKPAAKKEAKPMSQKEFFETLGGKWGVESY